MGMQALSTQYVALIGLVWLMTQRGDDVFGNAQSKLPLNR
jgi:hypothetical protein